MWSQRSLASLSSTRRSSSISSLSPRPGAPLGLAASGLSDTRLREVQHISQAACGPELRNVHEAHSQASSAGSPSSLVILRFRVPGRTVPPLTADGLGVLHAQHSARWLGFRSVQCEQTQLSWGRSVW